MSIIGVNQSSGIRPVSQSSQDSYEKNIQKQIANLQEKMKNIANDREKSGEQKMDEKKAIQEEIQSLNSELKQYQIQKRQEEEAKRQEAVRRTVEANDSRDNGTASSNYNSLDVNAKQEEEQRTGLSETETGVILSISHTREQVTYMQKVRKGLEGKMLTAETEEEKADLQRRIDNVSRSMNEKVRKIADKIEENQKDEQERKKKVEEILRRENEEKKENINIVLPSGKKSAPVVESTARKENFTISGKVSIS